ncbi:MAG: flagellar biosynthetic protein FliR [Gammaproteobacteria bacterium]
MTISDAELMLMIESWLWPFFRIAGLLMTAPMIGTRTVPVTLRLILAAGISIVAAPSVPAFEYIVLFSPEGFMTTIQQVLIGAGMGIVIRLIFMVLEVGGQVIAQQMGLGFAAMVDPSSGRQVPVVSQFYVILATLMFFSLNGHLIMIQIVTESFHTLPIGVDGYTREDAWGVVTWGGWLLSSAVLIALPAITAMMIVNISFGVMTRASPQLNIFAVGFPIMMIMGMFIISVTLSNMQNHIVELFEQAFLHARSLARIEP